jgi:hypothetical protein
MLAEMAAFRTERQQWEAGQAAAERQLAEERRSFEAEAKSQVRAWPAVWSAIAMDGGASCEAQHEDAKWV